MLTLGIDESARGPCIGSMFIVGVLLKEDDLDLLRKNGVKDSKLLSHPKRIELSKKIKKIAERIKITQVEPKEIDEALESDSLNLNWLEAQKTVEIINFLNPDQAVIDSPSPNLNAYKNYIYELIKNKKIRLIVQHKADKNFVECSCASIIAKCAREEEIKKIKKKYGNCGPGYTSNQITQKFIKENFEKHPEIFRKTWITYKKLVNGKKQKKLDEF